MDGDAHSGRREGNRPTFLIFPSSTLTSFPVRSRSNATIHFAMRSPKTVVTIPELAAELGIGKQKVCAWIEAGEIDRSQVFNIALDTGKRRQLVISRAAVDAFLAGRSLLPKMKRIHGRQRVGAPKKWRD